MSACSFPVAVWLDSCSSRLLISYDSCFKPLSHYYQGLMPVRVCIHIHTHSSREVLYIVGKRKMKIRSYDFSILAELKPNTLVWNAWLLKHWTLFSFWELLPPALHTMLGIGLVTKSCPTLATPWTEACQAPLTMGFSRQIHWIGLPFPSPGVLPNPGTEPGSPHCRQILYRLSYEGSTLCLGVTKFLTVLCVCHIYPSFTLPWPWILFLKYLWCFVNTLILFETQHRFHQFHLGFSHPSSKPRLDNAFLHCFSCSETVPKGTRPTAEKPVCRKKKKNNNILPRNQPLSWF